MDGEQIMNGVINYIENEIMPGLPRIARFAVRWGIRIARDWRIIKRYIDQGEN